MKLQPYIEHQQINYNKGLFFVNNEQQILS